MRYSKADCRPKPRSQHFILLQVTNWADFEEQSIANVRETNRLSTIAQT